MSILSTREFGIGESIKANPLLLKNLIVATIGSSVGFGLALASFRLDQHVSPHSLAATTTMLSIIGRKIRARAEEFELIVRLPKLLLA